MTQNNDLTVLTSEEKEFLLNILRTLTVNVTAPEALSAVTLSVSIITKLSAKDAI